MNIFNSKIIFVILDGLEKQEPKSGCGSQYSLQSVKPRCQVVMEAGDDPGPEGLIPPVPI
jgi:hypothetical protein